MQPFRERITQRNDPETSEDNFAARYTEFCEEFRSKRITIDVFRARLYSLGFRGAELETEVNLNWPAAQGKGLPR